MMKSLIFCINLLLISVLSLAQEDNLHRQSSVYEWPNDPLVLKNLEKWQDQKFGMIIHWGLYAVPGIIESWELCSEGWINRPDSMSYCAYKSWYWGLKDKFNPIQFDPGYWASAARDAGMKYVVFTTKHHDGFSMFDTKETDFSIANGPFSNNARADVAKHVFEAFRKEGFMVGAYFSKPDWHSPYYWWPKYATPDRNNNYDIAKYPQRWKNFQNYTYNQISELMNNYGRIDILWLDGGWVRPLETVNDEVRSWGAHIPEWSQDIDMPKIAEMARDAQPGILIVDRTVHGTYENYQTPERRIPENQLKNPWESCIPLGNNWGYVPNDPLKSSTQVIHQLIEVVAKGGSMLLGIGPKPDGTIDPEVVKKLAEIGNWMNKNGAAIYNTRTTKAYRDKNVFFTANKNGTINAIVILPPDSKIPNTVEWTINLPEGNTPIKLLSAETDVRYRIKNGKVIVKIPDSFQKRHNAYPALTFTYAE